jgi:16S rRNA (uracil1498-N3)-methyltransferase
LAQLQRVVVNANQIQAGTIAFDKPQSHYLDRVLRLRPDDRIIVMDGQGQTWLTILQATDSKLLKATIVETLVVQSELPIAVTLAIALPKGSGFDDVLRQVVELGVHRVVPILSARTIVQPKENKLERWQKIAQEAAEQSERGIVPQVVAAIPWAEYLRAEQGRAEQGQVEHSTAIATRDRLLCWERGESCNLLTALPHLNPTQTNPHELELAIGPEGGWTEAEVEAAIACGYQAVTLGPRILRAVTASVAAMAIVAAWQDATIR